MALRARHSSELCVTVLRASVRVAIIYRLYYRLYSTQWKWSKSDWSSMRTDTKSWANEWLKGSVTRTTQENYTSFCKHIQSLIKVRRTRCHQDQERYPLANTRSQTYRSVEINADCTIEQRSLRNHITGSRTNAAHVNVRKI